MEIQKKMSKQNSSKFDLIKNSIVIGFMTLISRITGLIRDMCLAHFVGSSRSADLFLIAMRIPNTFRAIFADGAFNNTFIPMLSKIEVRNGKENLKQFIKNVLSILFYTLLVFTTLSIIFMPVFITIFAGGVKNNPEIFKNLVMICRITFPFLLFISVARLFAGILEVQNKFCLVAFSPIITNILTIIGILFAGYYSFDIAIFGGIFFSIGGILQLYILFKANVKNGFGIVPHPMFYFYKNIKNIIRDKNINQFLKNIIPGLISGGIYNINIMVSTFFASGITGAISWIYYAERLVQLPLGVIGIAIGTVLLPKISSVKNTDEITDYFNKATKAVLFLMIPITVGLMIIGHFIIDVIYKSGTFNIRDVNHVNQALIMLSLALPFLALNRYISIVFYAKHDTKTPMQVALFCAILNLILSYLFVNLFGFLGVVVASVFVSIINFLILHWIMQKNHFCKINLSTINLFIGTVIASFIMGIIVLYLKLNIQESWNDLYKYQKILQIIKISGIGAFVYFGTFKIIIIGKNLLKRF